MLGSKKLSVSEEKPCCDTEASPLWFTPEVDTGPVLFNDYLSDLDVEQVHPQHVCRRYKIWRSASRTRGLCCEIQQDLGNIRQSSKGNTKSSPGEEQLHTSVQEALQRRTWGRWVNASQQHTSAASPTALGNAPAAKSQSSTGLFFTANSSF